MNKQTIYRVASRDVPFAQIANAMLRDRTLSIEARGALALILTYPPNWQVTPEWLADAACIGRDKARKVLRQLVKGGYCLRSQVRENRSKFGTSVYLFTDMPGGLDGVSQTAQSPSPENPSTAPPQTDLPSTETPSPENQSQKNTIEGTNTVEGNPPLPPKGGGPTPHDALIAFEAFNAAALRNGLPQAVSLTPDRRRRITARLREYGLDGWNRALANIERSPFLTGKTEHNFRADLDFVCQAKSFNRLHDGGYGNSAQAPVHAVANSSQSETAQIIQRRLAEQRNTTAKAHEVCS